MSSKKVLIDEEDAEWLKAHKESIELRNVVMKSFTFILFIITSAYAVYLVNSSISQPTMPILFLEFVFMGVLVYPVLKIIEWYAQGEAHILNVLGGFALGSLVVIIMYYILYSLAAGFGLAETIPMYLIYLIWVGVASFFAIIYSHEV